jgi:hypothetical protein
MICELLILGGWAANLANLDLQALAGRPRSDFAEGCGCCAVEHCGNAGHFRRDVAVSNSFLVRYFFGRDMTEVGNFRRTLINMTGEHITIIFMPKDEAALLGAKGWMRKYRHGVSAGN